MKANIMQPTPIPDYGDHMTRQEFEEACKGGCFIDDDGHGYYTTQTEMSDHKLYPSDLREGWKYPDMTHMVWFNK